EELHEGRAGPPGGVDLRGAIGAWDERQPGMYVSLEHGAVEDLSDPERGADCDRLVDLTNGSNRPGPDPRATGSATIERFTDRREVVGRAQPIQRHLEDARARVGELVDEVEQTFAWSHPAEDDDQATRADRNRDRR